MKNITGIAIIPKRAIKILEDKRISGKQEDRVYTKDVLIIAITNDVKKGSVAVIIATENINRTK
jgi:hypothetical protein